MYSRVPDMLIPTRHGIKRMHGLLRSYYLDLYVVDSIDSGLRRNDELLSFAKGSTVPIIIWRPAFVISVENEQL